MLKLTDIKKTYAEKSDSSVQALKGIDITFRDCEFVSILGPSGCGKTTLLNIIGGLDRYTSGDLNINGISTKEYKDNDWDTYRNHSVGFVFQSYNLIPHQNIIENVELSMTIGGVPRAERRERAVKALKDVGLGDKLTKKPNQLSGGQMQRVSIARAIVNEPDIILADEPTGALDSETSEQVMALLKEISKTKLVIMVTHNPDIAYKYSDRIIKMLDGEIIDDTRPITEEELQATAQPAVSPLPDTSDNDALKKDGKPKQRKRQASMSFWTAMKLSAKNLMSKKRRTVITSLAASIGIIGIAVILSVSSGMQSYVNQTMLDSASFNYISISSTTTKMSDAPADNTHYEEYPDNATGVYPYEENKNFEIIEQKISQEFIDYINDKCKDLIIDITYTYNLDLNILSKSDNSYKKVSSSAWHEMMSNAEYMAGTYDVIASSLPEQGGIPTKAEEVALVVDKYNRLPTSILDALGIEYGDDMSAIDYDDIIGKEFRIVYNDGWYTADTTDPALTIYRAANGSNYGSAYANENGITVKIVSVLREKEDAAASWLSEGIAYTPELTQTVLSSNKNSAVALAQAANETIDVTTGEAFGTSAGGGMFPDGMFPDGLFPDMGGSSENTYRSALERLGYTQTPNTITIYPTNVDNRKLIVGYLDSWNTVKEGTDETIEYLDMSSVLTSMLNSMIEVITYVLTAFSVTSLVISSIMIAIIIYASVIERTKEIGVLRSIGARKKDVSRVFRAEAVLLGLISGIVAIILTLIINVIINIVLKGLVGVSTIAHLTIITAICLIALSAVLLLIASLIPARIAAKKEPAVALRTE